MLAQSATNLTRGTIYQTWSLWTRWVGGEVGAGWGRYLLTIPDIYATDCGQQSAVGPKPISYILCTIILILTYKRNLIFCLFYYIYL